ncbi:putative ABC transport system ATP-binding protein [Nonomuraea solani]|uniref:Putative ABC transport system ATP-binding protein n=1 Tax=Nonomuraea solani TaxID=1144553 RepID=A0A1H6EWD4_9ACTN|nr:ABC transporter ATP-binding protein [Nonomuraea solani]SEH01169.1 putative ABC transport system ATP-binding protein [Nonomuraea solani]
MESGRDVLLRSIAGQRRRLAAGSLLGAGHQAGEALVPVLIGLAIDQAVVGASWGRLLMWLAVLAVVYVGLSFSYRFGIRVGERAAEEAAHDLRLAVVSRVLHPRGGAEEGRLPGALTSIATEDARRVGAVIMAVLAGIAALTGLAVSTVVLLRMSIPLGLIVLLGTPALLWLGHLLGKPLERRSEVEQERVAHASGMAADLVAGLRVLKGINAEGAAVERYRRTSRDSLSATLRAARAEALQNGVVLALTGAFIALIALVGGRFAIDGSISLGQLVSAVGLALFLQGPLQLLAWVNAELAQGRASAARVAALLSAPHAVTGGGGLPGAGAGEPPGAGAGEPLGTTSGAGEPLGTITGAVRLRGLTYDRLTGLDADIAPGELVGVAATDPAAATALLRCLGRQADPESGSVELDGVPLRDLDPARLREAVLVAEHDAILFEGTVRTNIGGTAPAEAMAAAGADQLPGGEDTRVSERGGSLSGGQRQRVALARALAAGRPVLVLHDPTTAVDAVTEARIAEGIRRVRRGRTTIVVTTSPALLAVADRVLLLDDGRVTDAAPHADLLRRNAGYRTAVLA